jgi:cytochrome c biogenesis factor
MDTLTKFTPLLDKFAVSTSAICAIHCLCLPLLLGVFPAMGATLFGDEFFHVLLLWLVIPLSLVALTLGCRKHKSRLVAVMGFAGLTFLVIAATLGHDMLGETGERAATLIGAIAIAAGHLRNYTLCRRIDCSHQTD